MGWANVALYILYAAERAGLKCFGKLRLEIS